MHPIPTEFMRFTAPDPVALSRSIEEAHVKLANAEARGDGAAIVDHAADLAGMLTTARSETRAVELLRKHEALGKVCVTRSAARS